METVADFDAWLAELPHEHKIVIAGNHDFCFEKKPEEAERALTGATYLLDSGTTACGIRFWGSPWQPWFYDWAFNLQRGPEIRAKWDLIPDGTQVLVTHGPPAGFGDLTSAGESAGCVDLLAALERVKPAAHVFGHIHEGYGQWEKEGMRLINASSCNLAYDPVNPPVVFEI
jgi:predicted phosphohydrolase